MAKVSVLNVKKVESKIKQDIRKVLRDKEVRTGVAEIVVDQIQKEKVPVTSEATKAWRKYLEQGNTTSNRYERPFINITFTGELLADLIKNIKASFTGGKSEYVIEHSDKKHKKYRKPNGKPLKGEAQSYKQIQGHLKRNGYEYLVFSNENLKRVIEFVKKTLFDKLKKGN